MRNKWIVGGVARVASDREDIHYIPMYDFVSTDQFRRQVADLAAHVAAAGEPIPIGTRVGRPRYVLRPAVPGDDASCLRVGPDEMRRNFADIRALVRLDGTPFGVVVAGKLVAIFARHPDYRPVTAEQYRQTFATMRGSRAGSNSVEARIAILEVAVAQLLDQVPLFSGSAEKKPKL